MKITIASVKDAPALARLGLQLSKSTSSIAKFKLKKNALSKIRGFLKRRMKKRKDVLFKAEDGGNIVGYVRLTVKKENPIYDDAFLTVCDLIVDEGHRGKGVGSALLEKCFSYAKRKGKTIIRISAYVKNAGALGLYKNKGFRDFHVTLQKPIK
ncbi:MAG TPA: GNAT family N-acetyltransferase [Candidatus Norongarragalinales archaeon]|nr:GNAT family N-acetyltransferase [Candidatus Norongarragalinales archaeon]